MSVRVGEADVLAAAQRVVARVGLDGATLERIAEEAGVSRTTLHRRGVSRAQLLEQLSVDAVGAYRDALWPAMTAAGTGRERLEAALTSICEVAEEHLALFRALGEHSTMVFHSRGDSSLSRPDFTEPIERLLRDGASDGSLREVDPTIYATALFNLVGWTYVHLRTEHALSKELVSETIRDIALNGLTRDQRN